MLQRFAENDCTTVLMLLLVREICHRKFSTTERVSEFGIKKTQRIPMTFYRAVILSESQQHWRSEYVTIWCIDEWLDWLKLLDAYHWHFLVHLDDRNRMVVVSTRSDLSSRS